MNLPNTKAHPLSPSSDDLKYVYLTLDASSTVVVIAVVIVVVVAFAVLVVAAPFVVVVVTNIDNNGKVAEESLFKKWISALDLQYILVSVTVNESEIFLLTVLNMSRPWISFIPKELISLPYFLDFSSIVFPLALSLKM